MFKDNPVAYFVTWKLGLQPALTQTTAAEMECLAKHASGKRQLVEIGVWHGVNTRRFREVMSPEGVLYAIDPFPIGRFGRSWHRPIAHGEAKKIRTGRIQFIEDFSDRAYEQFLELSDQPIDFLFIDGDHSYEGVKTDWELWSPKIAVGGVVALHDSRSHEGRAIDHTGPVRFTQDVVLNDDQFALVDEEDSLTVVQRQR